ncbi:anti-phage protein KwaB [Paraburkholderia fungorum]|uniref:anti-phage protein KwaB n=1 Tax=Paraburkholderia fungorum TaxID=134537 RepID=UPI00248F301D|nr:anti-phage protein KwaB [Paraburkholderia fungorum]
MKTKQELKAHLDAIFDDGVNMKLYFGLGAGAARTYKLADFDDRATAAVLRNYVAGVREFFENDELGTVLLSQLDQRSDVLVMYDLQEQPIEFAQLRDLQNEPEPNFFSFDENAVGDIRTIAIKIASAQQSIVFFKTFYPVSLVKRDQILLYKMENRFTIFDGDIIKVTPGFDVLLADGEFYINDFAKFEKAFSFTEIVQREMLAVAQAILAMGIVNDVKGYLAACAAPKRDILRAGQSDVLQLETAIILAFATQKAEKIGLKIVNGQFQLSSRESVKKLYKLLNDDYLTSGLTAFEYETLAKNKM